MSSRRLARREQPVSHRHFPSDHNGDGRLTPDETPPAKDKSGQPVKGGTVIIEADKLGAATGQRLTVTLTTDHTANYFRGVFRQPLVS